MKLCPDLKRRVASTKTFVCAIGVFILAATVLWWLVARRLIMINDEGMYLYGAERLIHGALPYRDFFTLTGPGIYWNLGLAFRLFGVSLAVGRALLVIDLALITACIFWLTEKLQARWLGIWVAWFYLAMVSADPGNLTVNHRWDSAGLLILAVCIFYHGLKTGASWSFVVAGLTCGYAAWISPPVVIVVAVLLVWALIAGNFGRAALFSAGVGGVSVAAAVALFCTHSFGPFLRHIGWTLSHYSTANRFPYGGIIGGYPALFADAQGMELLVRAFLVFFAAMPAIVPLAAVAAALCFPKFRRTPETFLVLCAVAAVSTCFPRMDVTHLTYAQAPSYAIAAAGFAWVLPRRARFALTAALSFGGALFAWHTVSQRAQLERVEGRVGALIGTRKDIAFVRDLERYVSPADRFFAFPYLPLAYFVTQAQNPTRYPYLQPGMMPDTDEQAALTQLIKAPPSHVLYMDVPASSFLRLFPSSDPTRLRMRLIEDWLHQNYEPDESFSRAHPGFDLLVPRDRRTETISCTLLRSLDTGDRR